MGLSFCLIVFMSMQDPMAVRESRVQEFIDRVVGENGLRSTRFLVARDPRLRRLTRVDVAFALGNPQENHMILFDSEWFETMSEEQVMATVAHELGHFYLTENGFENNQKGADIFALRYVRPAVLISVLETIRAGLLPEYTMELTDRINTIVVLSTRLFVLSGPLR